MQCRIGLVQMPVGADKQENLRVARREIERAVAEGAELVILPEMFCVPYETGQFPNYAEPEGGEAQQLLCRTAKELGCWIVGGSICEVQNGRYYNTSYVYNAQGVQVAKHRKKHLFDVDIVGGQYFKESDILSPGEKVTVFDSPWGRIGLAICFDIRFSDMAAEMVQQGARLLIYPAAFNLTTGPRHWELLFRARAVDGQCYAMGVAPARNPESGYVSWAHSLVVDPWGTVQEDLGTEACTRVVDIDLAAIDAIRQQIPLGLA